MRNAWCSAIRTVSAVSCLVPLAPALALPPAAVPAAAGQTPQILLPFEAAQSPGRSEDTVVATVAPLQALPTAPDRAGAGAWFGDRMRTRSDRTRVAFYPSAGSGVHVSGGSRLHNAYQPVGIALANRDALRIDPHRSSGPTPLSTGYDSYAPVALIGVDKELASGWVMGLDVGAMRGRAVAVDAVPTPVSSQFGRGDDDASRMNPVVDVSLNFAF